MLAMHGFTSYAIVWLVIAIVLGSIEVLVTSFVFMLAGLAALVPCVLASFGFQFETQVIVFAVVMILFLGLLRPPLLRKFNTKKTMLGRTEGLFGQTGEVTETFVHGSGRILVAGQDWAARGKDDFVMGRKVKVTGSDGIVLLVE
jgi:membrane protein implicated in regulation of membrane protease activity